MEENQQNQDIEFIKEKVKERPLNRKKLMRRTLLTASMAVIFGLIACFTFLVLEPVFSNLLYPEEEPQQVELEAENIEEEIGPEDMLLEEETEEESQPQTVVEKVELEMSDFQRLYRTMYALGQEVEKESLVTVTGVTSDVDWFNNPYENQGQTSGLIVADNGQELLILSDSAVLEGAESMEVTFSDGMKAEAELKSKDKETGLAVVGVELSAMDEETKNAVKAAVLGGSGSSLLATPVLALGRPVGTAGSVIFGMVTSTDQRVNLEDHNLQMLTTDMVGKNSSSGVLINLSRQVVGIIRQEEGEEDGTRTLTAYGITDLLPIIRKLSNGQQIAHLGITGTDVPEEAHEEGGVPRGAYVTGIRMDSPAMRAGIQSGDVITKLGTAEISSFSDYQDALLNLSPNSEITVTLMRQGQPEYQEMTLEVILEG